MDDLLRFLWVQFALHCNFRGWASASEFLAYTLRIDRSKTAEYDAYSALLFYDNSPTCVLQGPSVKCTIIPSHRQKAIHNIAVICTYIRAFRYACSDNTIILEVPTLCIPNGSLYDRIDSHIKKRITNDETRHVITLYRYLDSLHNLGHLNLLHFPFMLAKKDLLVDTNALTRRGERNFQELIFMRILYPELEKSLSTCRARDFIQYRHFCKIVRGSYARWFSDDWEWWPPTQTWVPRMYLWEYRYYMVRLDTLHRAMRRFVQQHEVEIDNLLWKPPSGLMVHKTWRSCLSFMEASK